MAPSGGAQEPAPFSRTKPEEEPPMMSECSQRHLLDSNRISSHSQEQMFWPSMAENTKNTGHVTEASHMVRLQRRKQKQKQRPKKKLQCGKITLFGTVLPCELSRPLPKSHDSFVSFATTSTSASSSADICEHDFVEERFPSISREWIICGGGSNDNTTNDTVKSNSKLLLQRWASPHPHHHDRRRQRRLVRSKAFDSRLSCIESLSVPIVS